MDANIGKWGSLPETGRHPLCAFTITTGRIRTRRPGIPSQSRGFTLAEVLVVGIIVAILAAVSVPMYTGYVKDQRIKAAQAVAQTAAVTAGSFYRRMNAAPTTAQLNDALSLPDPTRYNITVPDGVRSVHVVDNSDPSCTADAPF